VRSHCRFLIAALLLGVATPLIAGDPQVYMAVLASRKHRHNASDNPVVGTFVSPDRGKTWEHRGWREYIRTFYVEAGTDGTVWAACGNGILRSIDRGVHWRITTGWEVTEVLKVRVAPTDPRFVVAATAYGALRSSDGGESWRFVATGRRHRFTSDILIDRTGKNRLLLAGETGVMRSDDAGKTWKATSLRLPTNVILQHPGDPQVYWAGTEDQGTFVSRDGGSTWSARASEASGRTVYALAINPDVPEQIFIGTYGEGVFRSDDGGETWHRKASGLLNHDVHSLCVVPGSPTVILAGTMNGGLFRSTDAGETWQFAGHEDAQVWGLSLAPAREETHR
jgi:photosystem II stability/assembly factor-like uncharacterized protein